MRQRVTAGLLLFGMLALPPMRTALEQSMLGHMLVQIPLLVVSGYWLASGLPPYLRERMQLANAYGITGLALMVVTALFWMLPRHLDAALEEPLYELAKFLTLPLLLGIPLQLSWKRLTIIGQGLVWSNLVAMLWVLAWLYLVAPVRVCNNYLLDEQTLVGRSLLVLGFLLAAVLAVRPFISSRSSSET